MVTFIQDKYPTLEYIRNSLAINTGNVFANTYANVVDISGTHKTQSKDYIATIRITDPSIYPESVQISVFCHSLYDVPKVVTLGDIICLSGFSFKQYNGKLVGLAGSNSKHTRFMLFSLEGDSLAPYADYKGRFTTQKDHYGRLTSARIWFKNAINQVIPIALSKTISLSVAETGQEADILARYYGSFPMGPQMDDPVIVYLYDQNVISRIILNSSQLRLIKLIKENCTVRIRSCKPDQGKLLLMYYSDILVIPEYMERLKVPTWTGRIEDIEKEVWYYLPIGAGEYVTQLDQHCQTMPLYNAVQIIAAPINAIFRVKGYVISVIPGNPAEV